MLGNKRKQEDVLKEKKKKAVKEPKAKKSKMGLMKDGTAKKARAKNAFIFFSVETRPAVVKEHPDLAFGDVAKETSKRWAEVSAKDKAKYVAMFKKDKDRVDNLNKAA